MNHAGYVRDAPQQSGSTATCWLSTVVAHPEGRRRSMRARIGNITTSPSSASPARRGSETVGNTRRPRPLEWEVTTLRVTGMRDRLQRPAPGGASTRRNKSLYASIRRMGSRLGWCHPSIGVSRNEAYRTARLDARSSHSPRRSRMSDGSKVSTVARSTVSAEIRLRLATPSTRTARAGTRDGRGVRPRVRRGPHAGRATKVGDRGYLERRGKRSVGADTSRR